MDSKINIKRTQSSNEDFNNLIVLLDSDLYSRYKNAQSDYDKHNKIESIETVIVAYDNGKPIGCGCFKNFNSDTVEIKRMFLTANYRGMGISKLILKELENWAKDLGFSKAILETGIKQYEAIGLYEKVGYARIDNYGQYKDIMTSLCFEKKL
jgi:GNAT superfamily N-acetyltransferase